MEVEEDAEADQVIDQHASDSDLKGFDLLKKHGVFKVRGGEVVCQYDEKQNKISHTFDTDGMKKTRSEGNQRQLQLLLDPF